MPMYNLIYDFLLYFIVCSLEFISTVDRKCPLMFTICGGLRPNCGYVLWSESFHIATFQLNKATSPITENPGQEDYPISKKTTSPTEIDLFQEDCPSSPTTDNHGQVEHHRTPPITLPHREENPQITTSTTAENPNQEDGHSPRT